MGDGKLPDGKPPVSIFISSSFCIAMCRATAEEGCLPPSRTGTGGWRRQAAPHAAPRPGRRLPAAAGKGGPRRGRVGDGVRLRGGDGDGDGGAGTGGGGDQHKHKPGGAGSPEPGARGFKRGPDLRALPLSPPPRPGRPPPSRPPLPSGPGPPPPPPPIAARPPARPPTSSRPGLDRPRPGSTRTPREPRCSVRRRALGRPPAWAVRAVLLPACGLSPERPMLATALAECGARRGDGTGRGRASYGQPPGPSVQPARSRGRLR